MSFSYTVCPVIKYVIFIHSRNDTHSNGTFRNGKSVTTPFYYTVEVAHSNGTFRNGKFTITSFLYTVEMALTQMAPSEMTARLAIPSSFNTVETAAPLMASSYIQR